MNLSIVILSISCFFLLFVSLVLLLNLRKKSFDKNKSLELSELISEGLNTFIKRVSGSLFQVVLYLTICLFIFSLIFDKNFSWFQIIAFIIGAVVMSACLFLGLIIVPKILPRIIKANNGFPEESINMIYTLAAIISFMIMSLAILGLLFSFKILGVNNIIGYGLGIMFTAYFFRIGGGIFKAAADIGSNTLAKIEKNVPDFDRRNPGTILDISGDFIAKIMGFSSDVFSSFMLILISGILFPLLLSNSGIITIQITDKLHQMLFYIVATSLMISVISLFVSKIRISKDFHNFLFEGIYFSSIISAFTTFFIIRFLNINITKGFVFGIGPYFSLFIPFLLGLLGTVFIVFANDILTSHHKYSYAQKIAKEAEFGSIITIFNGLSLGLRSIVFFIGFLIFILMPSFYFADVYGITMVGLGMLSVITTILMTKIFSSTASSITKVVSLTSENENILKSFNTIDKVGKTSSSLGNSFAAAAAVISVFSILITIILMVKIKIPIKSLLLIDGDLLVGLILGVSIPYIFSGFLLRGTTKAVFSVIEEIKRQFRDIPYLFEDKARPDIIKAVDNNIIQAMNAMLIPTIIMVACPLIIGYIFEATSIKLFIGLICGIFLVGSNLGFYWANLGESLHQARNYIAKGNFGGKESPTYENALMADNFGDAFKDLLSPSINILIKSIGILSVLIVYLLL